MRTRVDRSILSLLIAIKGKGFAGLVARSRSLARGYGFTAARMSCSLAHLEQLLRRFECPATLAVTVSPLLRNRAALPVISNFEVALHGHRHVDHLGMPFQQQKDEIALARQAANEMGLRPVGFRSPYLRCDRQTLRAIAAAGLRYDSSNSVACPVDRRHVTPKYELGLSFYGTALLESEPALPSLDAELDLVRIPYCLPDDESLVERLQWDSVAEMNRIWPAVFDQIHQLGELFTLGLHPERAAICSDALVMTLERVRAESSVWRAPLSEIARWWRERLSSRVKFLQLEPDLLQVSVDGPAGATLLVRSLDTRTRTAGRCGRYQRVLELPCVVRSERLPIIGLAPDSSPALASFLKQQGYVVEYSARASDYTLYISRKDLAPVDRRVLLAEIERSDVPLVRLSRWPHAARSAFVVTGDIDGFTLWDYAFRFLGR